MTHRPKTDKKGQRPSLSRKEWKFTAIAAMAVALALLAALITVLTIGTPGYEAEPGGGVLAVVNGEDITADEVTRMQATIRLDYGKDVSRPEALERAINERLLYREAERHDYSPSIELTEQLLAQRLLGTGVTGEEFRQKLQSEGLSWEEYVEYYQSFLAIERYLDATLEVPEPTEEQAWEFYEEYKLVFPDDDRTFEEMEEDILKSVEWLNRERVVHEHVGDLRKQADIQYR